MSEKGCRFNWSTFDVCKLAYSGQSEEATLSKPAVTDLTDGSSPTSAQKAVAAPLALDASFPPQDSTTDRHSRQTKPE